MLLVDANRGFEDLIMMGEGREVDEGFTKSYRVFRDALQFIDPTIIFFRKKSEAAPLSLWLRNCDRKTLLVELKSCCEVLIRALEVNPDKTVSLFEPIDRNIGKSGYWLDDILEQIFLRNNEAPSPNKMAWLKVLSPSKMLETKIYPNHLEVGEQRIILDGEEIRVTGAIAEILKFIFYYCGGDIHGFNQGELLEFARDRGMGSGNTYKSLRSLFTAGKTRGTLQWVEHEMLLARLFTFTPTGSFLCPKYRKISLLPEISASIPRKVH